MCRSDINPAARSALGGLLGDMASALRAHAGLPEDAEVTIGPVDFGGDDPRCVVEGCPFDPVVDGRCLPHLQPRRDHTIESHA